MSEEESGIAEIDEHGPNFAEGFRRICKRPRGVRKLVRVAATELTSELIRAETPARCPACTPLCFLLATFAGWVNRHQAQAIDYLIEENRVPKEQLGKRRIRLTDSVRTAKPGDPGAKPPAEMSPPSGDVLEFELGGRAVVQRRVETSRRSRRRLRLPASPGGAPT